MLRNITPTVVLFAIGTILLFVAFYMALLRVDAFLRFNAVDACAQVSEYKKVDSAQSATITYPIEDVYNECLRRKGF